MMRGFNGLTLNRWAYKHKAIVVVVTILVSWAIISITDIILQRW